MGKRKEIKKQLKGSNPTNSLPKGTDLNPSQLVIKKTIDLILEDIHPAKKNAPDEMNRDFLSKLNNEIVAGLNLGSWDKETVDYFYKYVCFIKDNR
jgi:hypothetical protein